MADQDFISLLKSITQTNSQLQSSLGLIKQLETGLRAVGSSHPLSGLISDLKLGVSELEAFKSKQAGLALKSMRGGTSTTSNSERRTVEHPIGSPPAQNVSQDSVLKSLQNIHKKQITEEEKVLIGLRERISADKRYTRALDVAAKQNFSLNDLKGIRTRGTSGIEELQFKKNEGGINRNLDVFTNKQGGASAGISNQFRSFGQGVVRDIGELTKWSLALAAVYGPMQKLQELMQIMVSNQSKLADATIAANLPFKEQGAIFQIVSRTAQTTGESIDGVIDAFTQAYKATGQYNTQSERLIVTEKLLTDALTLSKLAGISQSESIDLLVASLNQANLGLDQGSTLLNKFVRITQVANVDLNTLATGVALLGDTSQSVGVDVDELSSLVAALAANSSKGSKEVANVSRALLTNISTDAASKELSKYGISVTDLAKGGRDAIGVITKIHDLSSQGLISDEQLGKISSVLYGGPRQGAVGKTIFSDKGFETFIKAQEASKSVTDDSTIAQDALDKKLETVQTSTTKLGNSFQSLAQTLGTDGGLLSNFTSLTDTGTALVTIFDKLSAILGKSVPQLVLFGAAALAVKKLGPANIGTFLGAGNGLGTQDPNYKAGNPVGNFAQRAAGGQSNLTGFALGALPAVFSASQNIASGNSEAALGNVVGTIVGGFVGSLAGPQGATIGAIIGNSVGESFVTKVLQRKADIATAYRPVEGEKPVISEAIDPKQREYDLTQKIKEEATGMTGQGANVLASLNAFSANFLKGFSDLIPALKEAGLDNGPKEYNAESAAIRYLRENPEKDTQGLISQFDNAAGLTSVREGDASASRFYKPDPALTALVTQLSQSEKDKQTRLLESGDISSAEYKQRNESISGLPASIVTQINEMGGALKALNPSMQTVEAQAFMMTKAFTYASTEQKTYVDGLVADYEDQQNAIDALTGGADSYTSVLRGQEVTINSLSDAIANQDSISKEYSNTLGELYKNSVLAIQKLPDIVGDYNKPITSDSQSKIVDKGRKIQEQFYTASGKTAEEIKFMEQAIEEFSTYVTSGGRAVWDSTSGLEQRFYSLAKSALEAEGALAELNGFGFQKFDVDRATLESAAAQSVSQGNEWAAKFPGFETKQEDLLALTNDGVAKPIHADFRILALLLEKIVDQNQKQLDGQYNIPEGATFWVPLTAAYYKPKNEGLGDSAGTIDTAPLDASAGELSLAGSSLQQAALSLLQSGNFFSGQYDVESVANKKEGFFSGKYNAESVIKQLEQPAQSKETVAAMQTYRAGEKDYDPGTVGGRYSPRQSSETYRTQQTNDVSDGSWVDKLIAALNKLVGLDKVTETGIPRHEAISRGQSGGFRDSQVPQVSQASATRLELKIDSTTQLMVDGRVLASIVTPFLAQDLINLESSQGTISKKFVI